MEVESANNASGANKIKSYLEIQPWGYPVTSSLRSEMSSQSVSAFTVEHANSMN